ncbi:NfeD family protein [Sandarakinorhabdus oryzae]|uniref:NfeD family protein n=1 Tax=Sandarakinorhabdus oryzae TaxID=2675220 RepID=UPI0012E2D03D|nr:NfeD family protein [Sandarakinorhabdus oryzae]
MDALDLATLIENPWTWAVLAGVLATAELVAPGVYLVWLAGAAAATAAVALLGLDARALAICFALFALASLLIARRWMRRPGPSMDDGLNQRGTRLIGARAVVEDAICDGLGRVKLGDSSWTATGPDLAAGTPVTVVAVDGNRVAVEPVNRLPSP